MMNQVGATNTVSTMDPNSQEKHQVAADIQHQTTSYYDPPSSTVTPWSAYGADNYPRENGVQSGYHHDQRATAASSSVQDGLNVSSNATTPSLGATNVQHDYSSYGTYQSNDPYRYNAGYAPYYDVYQQQPSQSYPQQQPSQSYPQQQPSQSYPQQQPSQSYPQQQPSQSYPQQQHSQSYPLPAGAYHNTGAPYQPLPSFPNTGPYAGPASYSSTHYNPGDYQTSGGYASGTYSNQPNAWHEGQHVTNNSHQYPNYSSDTNATYSSTTAPAASQYQQDYKPWEFYNQTQTDVTCAPGTENVSLSNASSLSCPIPGVTGGYCTSSVQAPASSAPSWKPEASSFESSAVQSPAVGGTVDDYWKHWATAFQNQQAGSVQSHNQKPLDVTPTYDNLHNQQNSSCPQGPNTQHQAYQMQHSYQSSLQTVQQTITPADTSRGKLQIPTNPRITSKMGLSRPDKDSSTTNAATKPLYISVSVPKASENISYHAADNVLEPGKFPKSLRGYVERALARFKDDARKVACQAVMKEIIRKATDDGTLHTRDWDTEPLFPMPNDDAVSKEGPLFSTPVSSSPKSKRSPARRSKSRWEPLPEEKQTDKPAHDTPDTFKYGSWNRQFTGGKSDSKVNNLSQVKFSLPQQKTPNTDVSRPAKRQRLGNGMNAANDGAASSDSDKEESLAAYYPAAIALADTPEERKRRENRTKRFEKGQGSRGGSKNFRSKNAQAGKLYARRATALVLSRNFEEGGGKAVEDIDWDALTVKGTCQEIEKRYLRLTSAPDPSTVRPEEVLEKALAMVQSSSRNYLYKCDQLKSIRQDLTVQHIRNELTVKVYETHGRLAIEAGDLPEYNQCQSQLKTLYAEGIRGCYMEFSAYNLLCVLLHSSNNRDLLSAMSRLSAEAKENEAVKHALSVQAAVTSGNHVAFFRLYKTAPNLNTCLMDLYVEKMRYAAVRCISRSYRPSVPVSYIAQILGFTTILPTAEGSEEKKDSDGLEDCVEWLKAHGACLISDNSEEVLLDAKATASSLYMPEPEDAVAHGDANLAVNDFFTRNPV